MNIHTLKRTLECFKGEEIELKLYNDIFGAFKKRFDKQAYEIQDHELVIGDIKIPFHEIMSVDLIATDERRIEMINESESYYLAFQIAKGHLVGSVIEALDERKVAFVKTRKDQEKELKETIKMLIQAKGVKLSVENVYLHLLSNTPNANKDDTALEKGVLKEIYSNIRTTIDKISQVDIF